MALADHAEWGHAFTVWGEVSGRYVGDMVRCRGDIEWGHAFTVWGEVLDAGRYRGDIGEV